MAFSPVWLTWVNLRLALHSKSCGSRLHWHAGRTGIER